MRFPRERRSHRNPLFLAIDANSKYVPPQTATNKRALEGCAFSRRRVKHSRPHRRTVPHRSRWSENNKTRGPTKMNLTMLPRQPADGGCRCISLCRKCRRRTETMPSDVSAVLGEGKKGKDEVLGERELSKTLCRFLFANEIFGKKKNDADLYTTDSNTHCGTLESP